MLESEFSETLSYLSTLCQQLGVRWALLGGVASNLYRDRPRLTQDVDVTIEIDLARWSELALRLRADGWTIRPEIEYPDVVLLRASDRLAVDVLVAKTAYQRTALDRALDHTIDPDVKIPVLAVEDVIIHKLIAGRHTDIDDIERILAAAPAMDDVYLQRWIQEWGLEERWEDLRRGL